MASAEIEMEQNTMSDNNDMSINQNADAAALEPESLNTNFDNQNQLHIENSNPLTDDESEIVKRKKLSLTLPLLNITEPDAIKNQCNNEGDEVDACAKQAESGNNKTKQCLESDDNFIQTIFSQTIKSTTATPTDDDTSYAFENIHVKPVKSSITIRNKARDVSPDEELLIADPEDTFNPKSLEIIGDISLEEIISPKSIDVISDVPISQIVKTSFFDDRLSEDSDSGPLDAEEDAEAGNGRTDPTDMFTYFHQTIEEDDPEIDERIEQHKDTASNTNTNTEALTDERTQIDILNTLNNGASNVLTISPADANDAHDNTNNQPEHSVEPKAISNNTRSLHVSLIATLI